MWDEEEFKKRTSKSFLWNQIAGNQDEIISRYSVYGDFAGNELLAKACIISEERTKEAIGAVGLTHLAYHSDAEICEGIADLIAGGTLPGAIAT